MESQVEDASPTRRLRICRPAMQDMQHLVMPRLAARAQLRRHVLKLRSWTRDDRRVADLEWFPIGADGLLALRIDEGFGLAEGFLVVFCELSTPEPEGTLCVLSVMRNDERFTTAALAILHGREAIARERLQ